MQNRRYSTEGIVLSKINYGEADRILTLFTKDQGKVRVIAKGVRKIKSRKRGHLEVFNQVRFSATKVHNFDIMTEAELIEGHSDLKKDLRKVSVAYYLVEIINKLTQTDEKHELLYYFLAEKLHELNETRSLKKFRIKSACDLLMELGFWPYGKELSDPDSVIEDMIEKKLSTTRVGKHLAT
jgi:DNA repair protein RecO (recombination protein O)